MLFLIIVVAFLSLPPIVIAILLGRWRPGWSYMRTALVAALPIPLLLLAVQIGFAMMTPGSLHIEMMAIAIVIIIYVFGVLAGSVGAWMAPRPPQLHVDASVEDVFR